MYTIRMLVAASLFAVAAVGGTRAETPDAPHAQSTPVIPQISTFAAAVESVGMTADLNSKMPVTVFAPDDKAFDALPADERKKLFDPSDKTALFTLVQYHMVNGIYDTEVLGRMAKVDPTEELPSRGDGNVTITQLKDGKYTITDGHGNTANFTGQQVKLNNGVIIVIDKVLTP